MRSFVLIISFVFVCSSGLFAQLEQTKNYGFNVGFVSAFGTHVQRFGVVIQAYYVYNFAQVNASIRLYDNFKDLGPTGEHAELNGSLGLCLGYGRKTTDTNLFVSAIGNQTGYKNSVAYSYNFWRNKIQTSQVTAVVAFQFNRFSVISENDLFAKPVLDRFRTGAMLIQYQYKQFQYAVNMTMWTGQLCDVCIKNDSLYPFRGYIDGEGSTYGNLSHGLLSGQVKYANEYGQYLQLNVGADSEKIRNAIQNRALHDVIPNNYHLPMIDTEGNQYLYRKGQKVKKTRLYINAYTSPNLFY